MRARSIQDIRSIIDGMERVDRLADGLIGFRKSYFRLGIDPFVNLIPVAGPIYTMGTGGYLLVQAFRAHVPVPTLLGMWVCLAIDTAVGTIPFAGNVADFIWRGQGMAARLAFQAIAETEFIEGSIRDARRDRRISADTAARGLALIDRSDQARRQVFLRGPM